MKAPPALGFALDFGRESCPANESVAVSLFYCPFHPDSHVYLVKPV